MFHTCEVCTIWPEAGIVKGLFWNTSFLKPHTPHTLSSHERLTTWTRFLVSSQISSKRLYSKASNHELECDSPCSLNSTIYNFIENSRKRHQPSLCSDCSISTKNLAAVCRPVWKQWILSYAHLSCDSPLQLIFIHCLTTKAPFQLLIGILLPIFN